MSALKRYKVESYDAYEAPVERTYLTHGYFDDPDEALACAKGVVLSFIEPKVKLGASAKEIYSQFRSFADIPWILGEPNIPFDAYDFAKNYLNEVTGTDLT